jgi:YVTN family beta-propeller protein
MLFAGRRGSMELADRDPEARGGQLMRNIGAALTLTVLLVGVTEAHAASGEVKEFTLTAKEVPWTLASGTVVRAWVYNGQLPGPEIRVKEGDKVRITFRNELPVASSIHWHGIHVPWTMDGPPGINQRPVQPGETFVYEFVAKPSGTHFYHSHGSGGHDEAVQMDMGLYGAFIIEGENEPKAEAEYTVVLSERLSTLMASGASEMHSHGAEAHGASSAMQHAMAMSDTFFMNGRSWPETAPLRVKAGERVKVRLINAGSSSVHPMHLHGHSFRVVAADGHPLAVPIVRDVIAVHPGERYDIEFIADNPGVWFFHCHELHHMDAGMALLVQYAGYEPVGLPRAAGTGAKVYVLNEDSWDVWVLDQATHAVLGRIRVGELPHGLTAAPDGSTLYVTNMGSNDVSVIDTATKAAALMPGAGLNPDQSALSPDGRWLYVSNPSDNTITVYDMRSQRAVATIPVGRFPRGVALSPDGRRLYVGNSEGGNVSVIDTASRQLVATISVGSDANNLTVSPDGKVLYVIGTDVNRVTFVDTTQGREIKRVTVGGSPYGATFDAARTVLWVANAGSRTVQAVDSRTGAVLFSVPVSGGPRALALSPDGKELWTADTEANTVSVIDVVHKQVIATIPVGLHPNHLLVLGR